MLKSQELVYNNYKHFLSQSFMNIKNKASQVRYGKGPVLKIEQNL